MKWGLQGTSTGICGLKERIPFKLMLFQVCTQCLTQEAHTCLLNKGTNGWMDRWTDGWMDILFTRGLKVNMMKILLPDTNNQM